MKIGMKQNSVLIALDKEAATRYQTSNDLRKLCAEYAMG